MGGLAEEKENLEVGLLEGKRAELDFCFFVKGGLNFGRVHYFGIQ